MLEILSAQFGIPRARFGISGYADTTPVDSNDTEEGRAHNRRVDIAILNQQVVVKNDGGGAAAPPAACDPVQRRSESKAP